MKAYLSGQMGVAAVVDGDHTAFLAVASTIPPSYAYSLLSEADDLVELSVTSQISVPYLLELECRKDRALQLFLILIDSQEDDRTVALAAEAIEESFQEEAVMQFVENRMYGTPLPEIADTDRAQAAAVGKALAIRMIGRLASSQAAVRKCREAWDSLQIEIFGTPMRKALFRQAAVDSGVFRAFALAGNDTYRLTSALNFCRDIPELLVYENSSQILQRWSELVLEVPTRQTSGTGAAIDFPSNDVPVRHSGRRSHDLQEKVLPGSRLDQFNFDAAYLVRLRDRDPGTRDHFCDYFHMRIRSFAMHNLPGGMANDFVQDVFVTALTKVDAGEPQDPGNLPAYVYGVAGLLALQGYRAIGKTRVTEIDPNLFSDLQDRADIQDRNEIREILGRLPRAA